jgi:uncharacterized RDD family membrane protein YckC
MPSPQDSRSASADPSGRMERTIDVSTGESVAFSYELAGLGSRFLAVFIDTAIQIAVAVAVLAAFAIVGSGLPKQTDPHVGRLGWAIFIALIVLATFLLFFGYFIIFELLWNGQTPGKRLMGIRVVRDGGFPIDLSGAVVRNVVRMLEAGLGFYLISAISTLASPLNRRLGDIAAGTLVVRDVRVTRAPVPRALVHDDAAVRDLTSNERDLIRSYAARRLGLARRHRLQLAARIAETIRPRLLASYAHLDDDTLLTYLAEHAL